MHSTLPITLLLLPFLPAILSSPAAIIPDRRSASLADRSSSSQSSPRSPPSKRIPLKALKSRQYSPDLAVRQAWLKSQSATLNKKYVNYLTPAKRAEVLRNQDERRLRRRTVGSLTLEDLQTDASYAGTVGIGTPAQDFVLIFDTGSSDTWVASTGCTNSDCQQVTLFDPSKSSSYTDTGSPFDITYGSGEARGEIATETVTVAGFTISGQGFGSVNQTSADVVDSPVSGIMGFAWQSIAQTGATPFWQELASTGQWSDSEMGFFLERYRGDASASDVETNGGELTMGGLDTSKYTGSMNYVTFDSSDEDYWRIPMEAITMQGSLVSAVTNRESAIDTGTTLLSASTADVQAIYAQIPNAEAMSEQSGYEGYWQYPCSTTINSTLQFGGLAYSMSNADFNLGSFTEDTSMCTGAIYEMDLGDDSPVSWIVGASFLKNVYSAFRYNPPAIGFAALSGTAGTVSNGTAVSGSSTTSNGTGGGVSSSGSGTSSGSGSSSSSGGAARGSVVGILGIGISVVFSMLAGLL